MQFNTASSGQNIAIAQVPTAGQILATPASNIYSVNDLAAFMKHLYPRILDTSIPNAERVALMQSEVWLALQLGSTVSNGSINDVTGNVRFFIDTPTGQRFIVGNPEPAP